MIKQNIPRVRFIGFNDEWKKDIIDNISERFDNLRVPITASNRVEGTTPYYGANGIQDYVEGYTHNGEYLLVAEDGASDLKNYPVQYVNGKVWVNNHAHVLSGKQEKISNLFFKSRLQILNFEKYLVGGSRAKLNADILMRMPVDFPKLPEQTQIGSLFSTIDSLLSSYKDKLENYQAFKKSMLSKMFPKAGQTVPEIRLDGFEGEWEVKKLGDVTERVKGNDGRMDLPTLTISAANGWMNQEERFSQNIAGKEQKNYTLLRKGELSYNHGNSKLAKYGVVFELENYDEALVPRVYHSFKVNKQADSKFIETMFATKKTDRELAKLVSSGARMDGLLNINFDEFMGITITIPSVSEQNSIGIFFSKLDNLISSYQTKINELETLKKKLLQDMFI